MPTDHPQNPPRPKLVLIAGPTASGKTTLAQALQVHLGVDSCALVPMDAYYRCLGHMPEKDRAQENFDHPEALEWPLLIDHVEQLLTGHSIRMPLYCFTTHRRLADTILIKPAQWVIVDGIHALFSDTLRHRADLRVFLQASRQICEQRRIARDTIDRGRSHHQICDQLTQTVWPMTDRYVLPMANRADLVLDGAQPIEDLLASLLLTIHSRAMHSNTVV